MIVDEEQHLSVEQKEKLKEHKLDTKVKLIAVDYNKEYEIGSFMVKWVPTSAIASFKDI